MIMDAASSFSMSNVIENGISKREHLSHQSSHGSSFVRSLASLLDRVVKVIVGIFKSFVEFFSTLFERKGDPKVNQPILQRNEVKMGGELFGEKERVFKVGDLKKQEFGNVADFLKGDRKKELIEACDEEKLKKLLQGIAKPKQEGEISPPKGPVRGAIRSAGMRTIGMWNHIDKLPQYDEQSDRITISGVDYQPVTHRVNTFADRATPLVSCGSSASREMILFDPKNSPELEKSYRLFARFAASYKKQMGRDLQPNDLLELTNLFLKNEVFSRACSVKELDSFIKEKGKEGSIAKIEGQPCIPIDEFIKSKMGVCRHHSIVAAYFIDRFVGHHPELCSFTCKVQVMREDVTGGAHAWVTIACSDGNNYALDTLNNIYGNLSDARFQARFAGVFGQQALQKQQEKAEKLQRKVR